MIVSRETIMPEHHFFYPFLPEKKQTREALSKPGCFCNLFKIQKEGKHAAQEKCFT